MVLLSVTQAGGSTLPLSFEGDYITMISLRNRSCVQSTRTRFLSMTNEDYSLPYAFQHLDLPQLRLLAFRCFWNLSSATSYVLLRSIRLELQPHVC